VLVSYSLVLLLELATYIVTVLLLLISKQEYRGCDTKLVRNREGAVVPHQRGKGRVEDNLNVAT